MDNLFFRNRRLLILAVAMIVVAGLSSYAVLPRLEDPRLNERAGIVVTVFPGADVERVESLVTETLEDELREIDEIKELRGTSRPGVSTLVIELRDQVMATDEVWSRVRDKLDDAKIRFPVGVGDPDFDVLDVKAYASIVSIAWTRDDEPSYAVLRRTAERLEDELRALPGTEDVELFGDPQEEIVVTVDPAAVAARGLTLDQVSAQIAASDAKTSAGSLRGEAQEILLEVSGELDSLERIRSIPIRHGGGGSFVTLGDVAEVRKGIQDPPESAVLSRGARAVSVATFVRPDYRIDYWSNAAGEVFRRFAADLPAGIELHETFEQNRYVSERLESLLWNLVAGVAAVMFVVLAMMGIRSALVVGAAVPLAALMTLTGLNFLGIPIHQMSVTGLIIALGLLIDNAIVIADEVASRLRQGHSPAEAVSSCVRQMALPLFGSTVTTALAFAPIYLMPGPAGEFVGSIAVSVILAIFSSLFLALTVVPAFAAMGRRIERGAKRSWLRDGVSFPRLAAVYREALGWLYRRPATAVLAGCILPILGFAAATQLPEQFFPPTDRDQFRIEVTLSQQTPLAATAQTALEMREALLEEPRIEETTWFLGESAPSFYYNVLANRRNSPFYAQAIVRIDSAENSSELIRDVQRKLDAHFPAARVLVRQLEQGPPFEAPVEVRLFGPDLDRLATLGESMRALLAEIPEVTYTRSDLSETLQKVELDVDEEQARLAGLDHSAIARQMEAALDGVVGGSILEETEELPVRVRLANAERGRADRAASLDLLAGTAGRGEAPAFLPVDALAEFRPVWARATIPHFNGVRMNEVQAYLQAGVLPDQALKAFESRLAESGFEMPPGYRMEFGGEASKRDDAVGNLFSSVGMLTVLMIATLVLSFGSFRMTGIIGGVAVLAVGLGLGSLWLFGYPFGFMAIIGTMGLIGVAINDSIVVLAALREDERARTGDVDGIVGVVNHATRHVLSTTMTTVAGFLPLILAGGQFWPPLAVAISGGVAGATAIALLSVPAAYRVAMCRESLRGSPFGDEQHDIDTAAISAPDTVRMSSEEADDALAPFSVSHARGPVAAN